MGFACAFCAGSDYIDLAMLFSYFTILIQKKQARKQNRTKFVEYNKNRTKYALKMFLFCAILKQETEFGLKSIKIFCKDKSCGRLWAKNEYY